MIRRGKPRRGPARRFAAELSLTSFIFNLCDHYARGRECLLLWCLRCTLTNIAITYLVTGPLTPCL